MPGLDFLPKAFEAMIDYLKDAVTGQKPIIDFKPPEELTKLVDFGIPTEAEKDDKILDDIKKVLDL